MPEPERDRARDDVAQMVDEVANAVEGGEIDDDNEDRYLATGIRAFGGILIHGVTALNRIADAAERLADAAERSE